MMTFRLLLAALIGTAVVAFAPQHPNRHTRLWSSVSGVESSLTNAMKDLLEGLHGTDAGMKLLAASSDSWRKAIYSAVAAPDHAEDASVAKSLQNKMQKPDSQFAILTKSNAFEANFPSDPVIQYEDSTAWIECRLREKETDKLLVTMGISLVLENDKWLISALDWQDFRDEFYPGLSGREWLRSF